MPIPISWRRREPTDIADLGPIQIMREAFRQFWTYIVHFLLIQLTLILPVVGVFAILQNKLLLYDLRALPLPPSSHVPHNLKSFKGAASFLPIEAFQGVSFLHTGGFINPRPFHPIVLISLFATFAFQAAQGLSASAILVSVGLIYTGQKVSFLGVIRSAIPILWLRLAITTLYNVFVTHSIVLLETAALLVVLRFQPEGGEWTTILTVVIGGAFGLTDLFLGVVFGVALGVSVLEEAYGWAAFKKALRLLKGKGRVAIWFHVVWSRTVPTVVTFALNHRAGRIQIANQGDYRSWSPTPLLGGYLNAVLFVTWTALFWQLSSLCAGVQYISFKSYHHESVGDSRWFQEMTKGWGYKRVGADCGHEAEAAGRGDTSIESGGGSSTQAQNSVL